MFYFKLLRTDNFLFSVVTSFPKGFLFFIRVFLCTFLIVTFRVCHFNVLFVPITVEPIKLQLKFVH